jgi:hypothetical protein
MHLLFSHPYQLRMRLGVEMEEEKQEEKEGKTRAVTRKEMD